MRQTARYHMLVTFSRVEICKEKRGRCSSGLLLQNAIGVLCSSGIFGGNRICHRKKYGLAGDKEGTSRGRQLRQGCSIHTKVNTGEIVCIIRQN